MGHIWLLFSSKLQFFSPLYPQVLPNQKENEKIKKELIEDDVDLERDSQKDEVEKKYRATGQLSKLKALQKNYKEKLELRCLGLNRKLKVMRDGEKEKWISYSFNFITWQTFYNSDDLVQVP